MYQTKYFLLPLLCALLGASLLFAKLMVVEAAPTPEPECFVSLESVAELKKFTKLDQDNLDEFLARLLIADFETRCEKIAMQTAADVLAKKNLDFEQKQELVLKLSGIPLEVNSKPACSLMEESLKLNKAKEFLELQDFQLSQLMLANLSLKKIELDELESEILYWESKILSIDPNCKSIL